MSRKKLDYYSFVTIDIMDNIPKWKRAGRTDAWIALKIGVSVSTMKRWVEEHKEFKAMFKKGRADLLEQLENSAIDLALGKTIKNKNYSVDSETGEILDNVVNISEKFVQSSDMLKHTLAVFGAKKWGKTALEGKIEEDESKVIFSGEDDI